MGCGPTAGAQVVYFWSGWYPNLTRNETQYSVMSKLKTYRNTKDGYTIEPYLQNGLVRYFHEKGVSHVGVLRQANPSYNFLVDWIGRDYVPIAMIRRGTDLNTSKIFTNDGRSHLVTLTGYDYTGTKIIFLNTGWGTATEHLGYGFDYLGKYLECVWIVR